MNEEFGLSGAKAYAKMSKEKGLNHVIAIESDGGGFTPKGLSIQSSKEMVSRVKLYRSYLEPYGIYQFASGGSGADISQLGSDDKILIGLRPDNHRYFEVHHSALDNIKAVNARELTMGSAALTTLMYLLDRDDVCFNCD
jgi:carboxypeptidase Q